MLIKNNTGSTLTAAGTVITAGSSYTIQVTERLKWQSDDQVMLWIADSTLVVNDGTQDLSPARGIDFLRGATPMDSDGYPIHRTRAFSSTDGFTFRGKGISGTATAGATTNIDYKLTEERWVNGCQLILNNHAFGDSITFQVVDVDNTLGYGAGVVLNEFGTSWQVASDMQNQSVLKIEYPARVLVNLYIRLRYTSVGNTNVSVACNLFLHKKA